MQMCAQNPPSMHITQPKTWNSRLQGDVDGCGGDACWGKSPPAAVEKKDSVPQPAEAVQGTDCDGCVCGNKHRPLASSSFPGPWRWSVSTPGWTTSQSWSRGLAGTPAYWPAWNAAGKRTQTGDLELKWCMEVEEEMKAMERHTEESRLKAGHSARLACGSLALP